MNEAIYRSPDWLKRFADFEIRTGKDIERVKDDKSKNTESKSKKSESNKDWDEKWRRTDEDLFKEFFKEVYPIEFKITYHSWLFNSDLEKIRNTYRGDFEIWNKFDKWLSERLSREQEKKKHEQEKKQREEADQERIRKELDDLINNLISDFKKAPYQDKASTPTIDGETCFKYIFEDDSVLLLKGNKLSYKNISYSLGLIYRNKFVSLANNLFKSSLWEANHRRPSNSQKKDTGSNSNNPKSSHPKWSLYQNLKQTVDRREEQLKKMSKDDPDRQSLENEYKIDKQTLDKMKNQYQFEHLVNFQKFN